MITDTKRVEEIGLMKFVIELDGESCWAHFDLGKALFKLHRTSMVSASWTHREGMRIADEWFAWMLVKGNELMNNQRKVHLDNKRWRSRIVRGRAQGRKPTAGQLQFPTGGLV